jgi:hypothetical protein
MPEDSKRWIWQDGIAQGPFTVDQLYRMATAREINFETLFWSDEAQVWTPLRGLLFDLEEERSRLNQMIEAGIERVQVLGSGNKDCKACSALSDKIFSVLSLPTLPPENCRCVP